MGDNNVHIHKHEVRGKNLIYSILLNLLITSALSKDKITSYKPGPNLDPTNIILSGCPTPLKLVLCFSINDFITGSRVSLDKELIFS